MRGALASGAGRPRRGLRAPDRARRQRGRGGAGRAGSRCSASRASSGWSTSSWALGARAGVAAAPRPAAGRWRPTSRTCAGSRTPSARLEIAAAGGHNLLMVGPPGAGKTMVARRLPGILPPPSLRRGARDHAHPQRGRALARATLAHATPLPRAPPHDLAAGARRRRGAAAPGRDHPRPPRRPVPRRARASSRGAALEALRQPLEDGLRGDRPRSARGALPGPRSCSSAPAIPCPCGAGAGGVPCGEIDRARYQRRLSGPLLDRIDIVCQVSAPPAGRAGGPATVGTGRARRSCARAWSRPASASERAWLGAGRSATAEMDGRRRAAPRARSAVIRCGACAASPKPGGLTGRGPRPRPAAGAHDRRPRGRRTRERRPSGRGAGLPPGAPAGDRGVTALAPPGSGVRPDPVVRRVPAAGQARRRCSPARIAGLLASRRTAGSPGCWRWRTSELVAPSAGAGRGRRAGASSTDFDADRAAERLRRRRVGAVCRHAPRTRAAPASSGRRAGGAVRRSATSGLLDALARGAGGGDRGQRGEASPYGLEMAYALGRGLGGGGRHGRQRPRPGHRCRRPPRLPRRGWQARSRCWPAGPTCPTRAPTPACTSESARAGLVVSELPPGQRPYRWGFPARNRIMAGLCHHNSRGRGGSGVGVA